MAFFFLRRLLRNYQVVAEKRYVCFLTLPLVVARVWCARMWPSLAVGLSYSVRFSVNDLITDWFVFTDDLPFSIMYLYIKRSTLLMKFLRFIHINHNTLNV